MFGRKRKRSEEITPAEAERPSLLEVPLPFIPEEIIVDAIAASANFRTRLSISSTSTRFRSLVLSRVAEFPFVIDYDSEGIDTMDFFSTFPFLRSVALSFMITTRERNFDFCKASHLCSLRWTSCSEEVVQLRNLPQLTSLHCDASFIVDSPCFQNLTCLTVPTLEVLEPHLASLSKLRKLRVDHATPLLLTLTKLETLCIDVGCDQDLLPRITSQMPFLNTFCYGRDMGRQDSLTKGALVHLKESLVNLSIGIIPDSGFLGLVTLEHLTHLDIGGVGSSMVCRLVMNCLCTRLVSLSLDPFADDPYFLRSFAGQKLRRLVLNSAIPMSQWDSQVGSLTQLEHLEISQLREGHFNEPESLRFIAELTNLRHLLFGTTNRGPVHFLDSLPASLRHLSLCSRAIAPTEFGVLTSLTSLDLDLDPFDEDNFDFLGALDLSALTNLSTLYFGPLAYRHCARKLSLLPNLANTAFVDASYNEMHPSPFDF